MAQNLGLAGLIQKTTSLSSEQIQILLDSDFGTSKSVRQSLEELGETTVDRMLAKLSQRLGVGFIKEIIINDISIDMIRGISINYAKSYEILPYKDQKDEVLVLTTNPMNVMVLDDLRLFV